MKLFQYQYKSFIGENRLDCIQQLIESIKYSDNLLSVLLFLDLSDKDYYSLKAQLDQEFKTHFLNPPLLTLVVQSPENDQEIIVELTYLDTEISPNAVHFGSHQNIPYITINNDNYKALLTEAIVSTSSQIDYFQKSTEVFEKIQSVLKHEKIPIEQIARQWNYIGQITDIDTKSQHYQDFNNARSHFYKNADWHTGYPAATGISMNVNAIAVQVLAITPHKDVEICALDNSLQIAAHRYSTSVLGTANEQLTPKFERAKILKKGDNASCFVSGTAAIIGEKSEFENDPDQQTLQTIQLILYLISEENLSKNNVSLTQPLKIIHLRVYVKYVEHFQNVRKIIEQYWPSVSCCYVCAAVCRTELLVEIEGIATNFQNI